ncbi:MAG: F0F1 ATP synthase subunit delta [Thiomonas sp.]|uniref:Putative ATP synthase B chain, sodium ion specific AtpF (Modular protein) n=1 Tax=mine drainage metagenome TaxID=410659 RepID=E6PS86_9ZZZZ
MSIDWWTIGLQAVNVLILVWLLGRYFWRPVADIIAKRQAAAKELLDTAQAKREQAEGVLAEVTRTRTALAREHEDMLIKAQAEVQQLRATGLQEAAQQAQTLLDDAQAEIAKLREAVERSSQERAVQLAVAIAQRLAARLDGQAVREVFLGWLVQSIQALPQAVRQTVVQSGTAELVSATLLDPSEQAQHAQHIGQVLGGAVKLTFNTDPSLIAGLELRGAQVVINNSWHSDLTRIRKEFDDAQRA